MNRYFVEMLRALSSAGAEFLVVGAHAVAAYGFVRVPITAFFIPHPPALIPRDYV